MGFSSESLRVAIQDLVSKRILKPHLRYFKNGHLDGIALAASAAGSEGGSRGRRWMLQHLILQTGKLRRTEESRLSRNHEADSDPGRTRVQECLPHKQLT